MNIRTFIVFYLSLLINISCNTHENNKNTLKTDNMINKIEFSSLHGKRVYFGHQSVGFNIIRGLDSLIKKNNVLNFIKVITLGEYLSLMIPENDSSFYFVHSVIGENGSPKSKLDDFQHKIDILKQIDAAFLKLCFVDFDCNTDVNLLYSNYLDNITELEKKYADIKFVYFTVPITTKRNIINRVAKIILSRRDYSFKRSQFNKLIRETSNIKFFDIAYLESHLENDTTENQEEYLLKTYASDAGHLNSIGSEKVALHLLNYLNNLLKEK